MGLAWAGHPRTYTRHLCIRLWIPLGIRGGQSDGMMPLEMT